MVSFSVKKKSRKYNKNNSIINRFLWFLIALLFLVPQFTFTAATPTGQLLKQLGSEAPLSYGDYVGSSAGLNTYYSYYIEVPASLSRLVIRIFDADVGMGGNHDWTSDSYNTSVTYTVYDPNGNTVTQNFTTGSSTGPSNSDNRWRRLCRVNSPMAGHWEVRVDMSSAVTSGNDMNGYGISAADNTGTELNIYAESFLPVGQLGSPILQTTQLYPYITSGGIVDSNDFEGDNGASTYCTLGYTTRLGATAGFNGSGASSWLNVALSGFNSDDLAVDYGIWNASLYYYNASSNFATYYMGNYNASNPPPTNQPETGTFRVYFPTNAGAAPVKLFLAQRLSHISGPNPPAVGSTTRVKVAVTIFNPTPHSITFSSTNPVTANIPGSGAVYAGNASVTQGSVTGQPSVGGTGNITWNPGTVSGSGNSETLYYEVDITPTSSAQRIPVTGTPAANGAYDRKPHPLSAEKKARLQAKKQEQAIAGTTAGSKRKGSLKISVKETGLYYLSAAAIANTAGILSYDKIIRMIGNHNFVLSNRGEEVSWLPAKGNSGLYFYGEKCDSIYTDKNIYWLTPGRGRRMQFSYGGSPMPGSGNETFAESLHIEEDRYALTALFSDPEGDFWLWDFVKGGEPGKTFSFSVPGPASYGSAYLTIELKGATETAAAADHHAKVSLNGTYLGECRWDGIKTHRFEVPIDPALLIDGQNSVEVSGVLDSGVSHSIFYVDSIDLNYHRYYRAVNNRLLCRGGSSAVITVSGFSHNKIRVFDVTEPKRPQLVRGAYLDVENRVSFIPAAPENRYFVLDTHGLRSPAAITVDKPSNLKQKRNAADYIVIAPPGLERAAANLADLRSYSGLEAMVVELEDIYDEFNHGIINPAAIKTFLTYAYHNWRGSGPKYAVLAGGGTYDYKDILGYGDNLIPPLMVNTPKGLFASDNRFGDAKGEDGVPEIAVGRLPVLTATELQSYIDKMSEYENSGGAWTGRALMLADNPDEGGDFTYDSDRLADLLPGYRVNKVYLPDFATIDKAREKAKQVIDSGAVLVNFIGYAGLDRLTAEGLLKSSDVSALQNGQKLPLFTTVTCVAGRFAVPGYDSLGETLALKAGDGAAAVWAPTGASYNRLAKSLAVKFFQALFQQQEKVIGRALVKAYRSYAACGGESFILDIYNLLGDPALRIK